MKKIIAIAILLFFIFPLLPSSIATNSWIKIVEPSPGMYWQGRKIFPLKNAIILIGYSSINVEAEGSENIIMVYFSMYDIWNKNMVASFWDINNADGWSCSFDLERGGLYSACCGRRHGYRGAGCNRLDFGNSMFW